MAENENMDSYESRRERRLIDRARRRLERELSRSSIQGAIQNLINVSKSADLLQEEKSKQVISNSSPTTKSSQVSPDYYASPSIQIVQGPKFTLQPDETFTKITATPESGGTTTTTPSGNEVAFDVCENGEIVQYRIVARGPFAVIY